MKRTALVVVFLLGLNSGLAFAQAPARPTPQTTPTAPATPAAPTSFTVTSIVPVSVVSAANDYPKLVKLVGANLDKVDVSLLKLSDGTTDLTIALADQPTAKTASLTVTIPANSKGEFVLSVDGTETKSKLVVKDADQVAAEKAEAERRRAIAQAAAAAAKVKTLETQVSAIKTQITALAQTVGTDNGQGGKIASLESANMTLTARVAALEAKVNAPTTGLEALGGRVIGLEQADRNQNQAIGAVAAVVVNGGKKSEKEAVRELLARLNVAIIEKK